MSSYLGRHAELYDLFYAGKDYRAESEFVHRALQENGVAPGARILELACGTGSHALQFSGHGYSLLATDYSADMLSQARRKAAGRNIEFRQLDMSAIEPALGTFDAVVCLFDSIGYLQTNERVAKMLAGVERVLRPGGVLVFEFWHAAAMLRSFDPLRVRRWEQSDGEIIRISKTSLDIERQVGTVDYEVIELLKNGTQRRLAESQSNRFFSLPEMSLFLAHAGLHSIAWYGGFTPSTKIDAEVWHIVAVAKKPAR